MATRFHFFFVIISPSARSCPYKVEILRQEFGWYFVVIPRDGCYISPFVFEMLKLKYVYVTVSTQFHVNSGLTRKNDT